MRQRSLSFTRDTRSRWWIAFGLIVLGLIAGFAAATSLGSNFGLGVLAFLVFLTLALIPLSVENRLIVTNLEIEFQMLLGGKLIHRLEGVRSIKLRYTSSGPYLELTRNFFSSFSIQYDWKEAYPTINPRGRASGYSRTFSPKQTLLRHHKLTVLSPALTLHIRRNHRLAPMPPHRRHEIPARPQLPAPQRLP